MTAAGWLSDGLDLVPVASDPTFIDAVLRVCNKRGVRHLIPTIDTELQVYAQNRNRFLEQGVEVWVSEPETIAICANKRLTNRWLKDNFLPSTRQVELVSPHATPRRNYPLIAKPAAGSSSRDIAVIKSERDLKLLDPSLDYILEEIAPGAEYTVDVLVAPDGSAAASVPRQRLETRGGEVSKGITARVPEVQRVAESLVSRLPGSRGVLNVQIFYDKNSSSLQVIEVNARFGGGFPLTWAAGALFPLRLLQWYAGVEPTAPINFRPGVTMLRYDSAVFLKHDPADLDA